MSFDSNNNEQRTHTQKLCTWPNIRSTHETSNDQQEASCFRPVALHFNTLTKRSKPTKTEIITETHNHCISRTFPFNDTQRHSLPLARFLLLTPSSQFCFFSLLCFTLTKQKQQQIENKRTNNSQPTKEKKTHINQRLQ